MGIIIKQKKWRIKEDLLTLSVLNIVPNKILVPISAIPIKSLKIRKVFNLHRNYCILP